MSKVIIRNGKIVDASASTVKPNETSAREKRKKMTTEKRKEMLQKNQVEYYKAYPEQAKNLSPELRRLLS